MNDNRGPLNDLPWTASGVEIPLSLTEDQREALEQCDTARMLVESVGRVLEGIAQMRGRQVPAERAEVFAAAEFAASVIQGLKDEMMAAKMLSHNRVAEIQGISPGGAKGRRRAARRAGLNPSTPDGKSYRYAIGYRPVFEEPREWYRGERDDDTAQATRKASGSVVVNVSTGATGIQSAGSVDGRDVDL